MRKSEEGAAALGGGDKGIDKEMGDDVQGKGVEGDDLQERELSGD